jgi:glycosyltransferase involved in cell wall biosynthesis
VPTPLARATIRRLAPALSVFYWTDRMSESSPGAALAAAHERALFAEADRVLTTSTGLLDSARPLAARAALFQTGVRTLAFERAREARSDIASQPRALLGVKRPIVGYVGSLRNEMDRALLAETARLAPDLTFVLAGPVLADVSALKACPNVMLLGPMPHDAAVHHMAWFDAGIIPYVLNTYTADIMPVKLLEYLAAGLPVIATGLPPVREFVAANDGPVVSSADGAEALTAALRTALATDTPAHAARRVEIARRHDWSERIATLSALMDGAMAVRRNGSPHREVPS